MSDISLIRKLKKLNTDLVNSKLEASKLPIETSNVIDLEAMANALQKQQCIELDIEKTKALIVTKNAWHADTLQASEIKPVAIDWLWPQWIPRGKLTVLAGAGGTGKTTMALSIAATLSKNNIWPDGTRCSKNGNTIIWSSEDNYADTLLPRLIAADADLKRVYLVVGKKKITGEVAAFDPTMDWDTLRSTVEQIGGVSLLIIDPIVNCVKGDMNKASDVRKSLQVVVDFGQEYNCTIIGITHFSKGSAGAPSAERVLGSQGFTGVARMVLVVGKQENSETRVIARAKSNISNDQDGFSYSIELCTVEAEDGQLIETTKTVWGDYIKGSANQILSTLEASKESGAVGTLKAILIDGKKSSKEVNQIMLDNGYSYKQTRTAREKLDITIDQAGFGEDKCSTWELSSAFLMDSSLVPAATHEKPIADDSIHIN